MEIIYLKNYSPAAKTPAQSETKPAAQPESTAVPAADVQAVDVNTLELVRPRSVGVEHIGLWAMCQVGFPELLLELGMSSPIRAAILGVIIGRMAAPGSELAAHRWLGQQSSLGELLDVDFERMPLMTLYRASDALMKYRDIIERTLFNRVHDLLGLNITVTLYDLTNTYFEGTAAANPKANNGRSKEKRSDCPLVTLGRVLDGSGFVRRSETFEGNVSEGKTLERMLNGLGAPAGALVVMDAGIATEANLIWLSEHGYRYLVVSRERARQFEAETAIPIETAAGATVHIQRVDDPDNKEVRLYCYSEQREQKEQGINRRFCERFEAGLKNIADGLGKPRTEKRLDKLHQRIGRLKEKSKGVSQHYDIELLPDASGKQVVELRWTKQPQAGTRLAPTPASIACAATKLTGTASACGAPISCSPTWKLYSVVSNPNSACARSTTIKKFALTATCSSPYWLISSCKLFANSCKNTTSKAAGAVCGRSFPCSSASQRPSNVLMAAPCISAKPHVRKRNWRLFTKP